MRVLYVTQKNQLQSYLQDIYGTVSKYSGEREGSS
jgi:hypothetical protein